MLISKHIIIKDQNNDVLYIYLNKTDVEFANELDPVDIQAKDIHLVNIVDNYIKDNRIDFKGSEVKIVLGGMVITTLDINSPIVNKEASNSDNPKLYTSENLINNEYIRYTVKQGDTLSNIALNYDSTVKELMNINSLSSLLIHPNQILNIPRDSETYLVDDEGGFYYIVKNGDTLSHIAIKYNVSVNELLHINNLTSDVINLGQKLIIPNHNIEPIEHIVEKNDTLTNVAFKYDVTVSELKLWNNLTDDIIYPEQRVLIYKNSPKDTEAIMIGGYDLTSDTYVKVYRSEYGTIEVVSLEEYIFGVVASEIPASFSYEALKTQAVISRTYIMYKLQKNSNFIVTDTSDDQIYNDKEDLKWKWTSNYEYYEEKISRAVYETKGEIIKYNDEIIKPAYFSTSNGMTQNSEDFWKKKIPYLRSVESYWDVKSPYFLQERIISFNNINSSLGANITDNNDIEILEITESGYVTKLRINNKEYSGTYLQSKLRLNSTSFDIEYTNEGIKFLNYGLGHGVGLSQYGANGMAQEGHNYEDIIKQYYTGAELSSL